MHLTQQIKPFWQIMRIDKPIGTLLLLWPTLWALWLAGAGHPDSAVVGIFVAGVFIMRSAGCVINDFADRHFDGAVKRTKQRPLAVGSLTSRQALQLFGLLLLIAFALVLFTNTLTVALACVAVCLASIYPFIKRFSHMPQFFFGVTFSWGIPMAFAAQTNTLPLQAWVLFAAASFWPVAYDTQYAMVDRDDDLRIGLKSTAILFGQWDRIIVAFIQVIFLALMACAGSVFDLGLAYYVGLIFAAVLFIYQHYLIRERLGENCFKAFLNNNWVGCVIFAGVILSLK